MTQPSQTDSSEAAPGAHGFPVAASGRRAQQDISAECAVPDFTGKKADGAGLNEPCSSHAQNSEEGNECILKLVASLEPCNMALFSELVQARKERAASKNPPVHTLPGTGQADHRERTAAGSGN